jgi:hypothetical protein
MFRPAPVFTALVLVAFAGLAHGLATSRWHRSAALERALARVADVPLRIGSWQGHALPTDPEVFAQARAEAYWMRRYQETGTARAVTVILMCGRPGPLAVHTPDVCYRGAGYEMAGSAASLDVSLKDGTKGQLWTAVFSKEQGMAGGQLRLFWMWNADGQWQAPASPRMAFAGRSALYKLYVVRELAGAEPLSADPTLDFIGQLLPALNGALFPPDKSSNGEL